MDVNRIDPRLLPREVREGGEKERELYASALGFESMLVRKLAESLSAQTGENEDGEGGDAAASTLRNQLPEALADGIAAAGGLGLAPELYRAMRVNGESSK
jgi:Rod binding domain-containing protein